ncbi:uncharacterized protein YndB with AHSA1/START domain [Evansella vedderi]|uniref:Uncharacterized protein YndB with AHSA1/START domain n=1 Tax=Evansella vedderi TaxID=38282 RepID=A0ABT9ZYK3_9BACI|nr:SRPBCC domain-containing protein [Evansella vedderi]MDQ0256318.1 uncharacterized protein YndB with AHSA1/START domain [Evansella vedderi]
MSKSYIYEVFIKTSPVQLWEVLTNGDFTKQCVGAREFRSEWKVGAKIEAWLSDGKLDGKGKVLAVRPYKLLIYNWNDAGDDLKPSIITYRLEELENENVVKFTLIHENLLGRGTSYWPVVISDIKTLLETGSSMFKEVDRVTLN